MMLTALALATLAPQAAATPKIESAALFKNGFAMVVRKFPVQGQGAVVAEIPQAALGTFWITTTGDLKIEEVVTTQVDKASTAKPGSFDEFLQWNIGKVVSIRTSSFGLLEGKLVHVAGDTLLLEIANVPTMIPRAEARMVTIKEGAVTTQPRTTKERVMRFKTRGTGEIHLYGLERGMTWSPAYSLDITDPNNLEMVAKATVLNDLGDFNGATLKLVTGFPNVPWSTVNEPLLSGQSVDQFTGFLASIGIPADRFAGRRDAMTQNAAPASGGFGGGFDAGFATTDLAEDLFFYNRPAVTLKKGDRAFYVLLTAKSPYSHLYTVEMPDTVQNNWDYQPMPDGPRDVWHSLQLKNTSGQPLTTAPVSVYKGGQLMGQDTLMYTSTGADMLVKMSKALDIRVEAAEQELNRERGVLRVPNGNVYDLVTLQGVISIRNFKSQDVSMRMVKALTGEIESADLNPTIIKTAKGLREVNPTSRLTWTIPLKGGQQMDVKYTYKLYVRTMGF